MANENRLIYSESLLGEASKAEFMGFCAKERKQNFLDMISAMLDNCPTVDAVEVVHGRWIWSEENECWVCSNCELSALNNYRGNSTDSNYCPHCGAKMDGGNEDG